jgi:hypothetical protein
MEDLVDDGFGVSFQFGVHGEALLLTAASCRISLAILSDESVDRFNH